MKKILILVSLIVVFLAGYCTSASAQTVSKVGDPTAYMTQVQLAQYYGDLKIADLEQKLETYGNWVGVGGEVGNAIKEGLTAVVDVADQFGKTDVGKFTLVLVAWKVVGKDLVRIALGLLWFVAITFLFIRVYRNTYQAKRKLVERTPQGFWKRDHKKWEVVVPDDNWDGYHGVKILILFMYAGAMGLTYAIMFA